jgi:drug/metabolite transporter (DMT)-like permease
LRPNAHRALYVRKGGGLIHHGSRTVSKQQKEIAMLTERLAWALMFLGFITSTASQIIIKARLDPVTASGGSYRQLITDPLMWLAVVLILSFVVCWYTALTKIPLSVMMAWSAVVLPLTAIGAWMFLGEPLGVAKMLSILVIAGGVAALTVF